MFSTVKKNEDGMDLIEVLIAIVLVLAAMVSLTFLLIKSQKTQAENETVDKAALILQDYSEQSRVVPWDRLGTNKTGTCLDRDLACRGEAYYRLTSPPGGYAMPFNENKTVSGTEYNITTHVTKWSTKYKDEDTIKAWENIKSVNGFSGSERSCESGSLSSANESKSDTDEKAIPCTLKHITIVVSWTDSAGETRSIDSSWVRSPSLYDEVSPSFTGPDENS